MQPRVSLIGIIKAFGFAAAVFISVASVPLAGNASSHREAPLITTMPKTDGTDFYMFNSYEPGRAGFVTTQVMAMCTTTLIAIVITGGVDRFVKSILIHIVM